MKERIEIGSFIFERKNITDDTKFFQQFLNDNGNKGIAEIEIQIKQLEELEYYEYCLFLKAQIELYESSIEKK